jgi:hypothetical protein
MSLLSQFNTIAIRGKYTLKIKPGVDVLSDMEAAFAEGCSRQDIYLYSMIISLQIMFCLT